MYELISTIGVYVMSFIFGITIGSFLNVCIYRLPKGESLIKRNSHCMTCGEEIKRYDLIPLFSWLFLRGKCRACKSKISPRYMLVEGLTGLLFMFIFTSHDFISDGLIYSALLCLFTAGLIVIGFEDFDTQEMSISVLIYLGIIAFGTRILAMLAPTALRSYDIVSLKEGIIGMLIVSIPLLILGFVLTPLVYYGFISEHHKSARKIKRRLKKLDSSDKERQKLEKALEKHCAAIKEQGPVYGFGMGDVILMAAGGLMLGYKATLTATFIAVVTGALYGLILSIRDRKKSEEEKENAFAFGPFLVLGLIFAIFFGTKIYDLYVNSLMLVDLTK